jgi:hypothetical protein
MGFSCQGPDAPPDGVGASTGPVGPATVGDDAVESVGEAATVCGGLLEACCSHNKCSSHMSCKNKKCRLKDGQLCDSDDSMCVSGHCNLKFFGDDFGTCGPCGKANSNPDLNGQSCCNTITDHPTCGSNAICRDGGGDGSFVCSCGKPGGNNVADPLNDPENEPCCGGKTCNDDSICKTNSKGHKVCVECGTFGFLCCADVGCTDGSHCSNGRCVF